MKNISEFKNKIQILLTDIDDTITENGKLEGNAYEALWKLHEKNIHVVPVTGRPAGWCEMIARFWPVHGVIGENGAFYFRYANGKMQRTFAQTEDQRNQNNLKLKDIEKEVLKKVPGTAISSDQFCRLFDLAIDFCEDVPKLPPQEVQKIVDIFTAHGAQAKVSSIHVNGWFGSHDKLSMTLTYLKNEFTLDKEKALEVCAFSGDSPNDEPMFKFFKHTFAVANFNEFAHLVKHHPQYITNKTGGNGFTEITTQILKNN